MPFLLPLNILNDDREVLRANCKYAVSALPLERVIRGSKAGIYLKRAKTLNLLYPSHHSELRRNAHRNMDVIVGTVHGQYITFQKFAFLLYPLIECRFHLRLNQRKPPLRCPNSMIETSPTRHETHPIVYKHFFIMSGGISRNN